MANWTPAQMRGLAFLLLLLAAGIFTALWNRGRAAEEGFVIVGQPRDTLTAPPSSLAPSPPPSLAPAPPAEIVVHVAGAVKQPGVYRLPPGARADDALKAAGGARPDANPDAINLAEKLEDGRQLYVPTRQEQPSGGASEPARMASASSPVAKKASHSSSGSSTRVEKLTTPGQGTVNINTATAEELQRLPGVGPSYAARILQFRKENGPFTSPEQLMDISGIGEKRFEKMKPFVRVR
jgi:competence protein ComEA